MSTAARIVSENHLLLWPGKSVPDAPPYPAACHMLDVAAVAELLIRRAPFSDTVQNALVILTALHDLGKFSDTFRSMLEKGTRGGRSHWELSECFLLNFDNEILEPILGGDWRRRHKLYAATAGHHGKPPHADSDAFKHMLRDIGVEANAAAKDFTQLCLSIWPQASLKDLNKAEFHALSWWLPGFVTVCDWIGSNIEWLPPTMRGENLGEHLAQSRMLAAVAVKSAGLTQGAIRDTPLYDFTPRSMQLAVSTIALREGPMLAIIEDETGAGKTEAAMLLAQRMLLDGKGTGIFFALPTMATSNAMFTRAEKTVGKLFDNPSLTLAHGRAGLNVLFNDVRGRFVGTEEDVTCAPWLADSRRKALLAQVGVGTIDQAFLAALPTKHNCLRIWGLSQKILIVDEVHEMGNPYMKEELKALLKCHAMQGSSAILLSATLPLKLRQELANAFEQGAGRDASLLTDKSYPALNVVGGAKGELPVVSKSLRGVVRVERLGETDAAAQLLVEMAAKGAACIWIRNSVDDCIEAVRMLEALGASPLLFHARFAFGDRRRIETEVLNKFGKDRNGGNGQILVASQVAESSLSLDFDVMVSDLAPMASLVQRAGRLWRYMDERPASIRPVPTPILHVLSPDPSEITSERWLKNVMDKGSYVYPAADQWRTANHLFKLGKIDAPDGLRDLIEAVHSEALEDVPSVLERAELQNIGKKLGEKNRGQQNAIDFMAKDYRSAWAGLDDVNFPTRLGPEQRTLMLLKRENGMLQLWSGYGAEGEMLSEVSAAKYRLDKFPLPQAGAESVELLAFKKEWPEWKKRNMTVVEVKESGSLTEGLIYNSRRGLVFHSQK